MQKANDDNAVVQHQAGSDVTQNRDAWSIYGQGHADFKIMQHLH